jgi:hypothetical protein
VNVFEYAIARCAHAIEQKDPALRTKEERHLLWRLAPLVESYRKREEERRAAANTQKSRTITGSGSVCE